VKGQARCLAFHHFPLDGGKVQGDGSPCGRGVVVVIRRQGEIESVQFLGIRRAPGRLFRLSNKSSKG